MEPWDSLVTSALNLTLGGGAFYVGSALVLYLVKRWNELEPKPKQPQVKIPLTLKEQTSEAVELQQQDLAAMAMPSSASLSTPPLAQPPIQPPPIPPALDLAEPEPAEPPALEPTLPDQTDVLANQSDAPALEHPLLEPLRLPEPESVENATEPDETATRPESVAIESTQLESDDRL